jgi:hypothetical protein
MPRKIPRFIRKIRKARLNRSRGLLMQTMVRHHHLFSEDRQITGRVLNPLKVWRAAPQLAHNGFELPDGFMVSCRRSKEVMK